MSVKALACGLPPQSFHAINWREGTNEPLSGRLAVLRVRHAGGNAGKALLRPLQFHAIGWPAGDAEPSKYVLSTLREEAPINELVAAAHHRWRIERDFLMAERLIAGKPVGGKRNVIERQVPALPKVYISRGSPARAAARGALDHDTSAQPELRADRPSRPVPLLRQTLRKATLVTQQD